MFYNQDEEALVRKFNSYKDNASRNYKTILTKFLSLREQELLSFVIGKGDVYLYFSSFSSEDEYKRAVISPFEIEPDFKISLLKLNYNKKFITLDHRHLLGNIMGLQIERNMLGNILINKDNDIYIEIASEMEEFLKENLRSIDHTPIELINVDKLEGDFSPNLEIKKHYCASLRVDLIIAEAFNLSRKESLDKIMEGNLKINSAIELNPCKNIKENDIISLRGKGRIKIISIGGLSKSGKTMVEIGKYM